MSETPTTASQQDTKIPSNFNTDVMEQYNADTPNPDYKDPGWKVSSAGLVWDPDSSETGKAKYVEKDGSETLINMTIDIGESGKGKILIACESGVEQYVRELADEENHLPNSKTGVCVHYLLQGIAQDFGTTFTEIPTSLTQTRSRGRGGRDAGKIPISKAEKNELIDKLDISHYEEDIRTGRLTFEDAMEQIKLAFDKKTFYENQGYLLPKEKTLGVQLFNWQRIVNDAYEHIPSITGSAAYLMNKIEVLLPNVYTNYFEENFKHSNRKMTLEMAKSPLMAVSLDMMMKYKVGKITPKGGSGGLYGGLAQDEHLNSQDDLIKYLGHKVKGQLMGIHLVKNKKPGMSKPRYILFDEYLDGKQILSLYGPDRSITTLHN